MNICDRETLDGLMKDIERRCDSRRREGEKMNTELVLIRGLPGSGKRTMAKRDFLYHIQIEADIYFYTDGRYKYDPSLLKKAHEWCQTNAELMLKQGKNVVVANTFIKRWEMQPYLDMAKKLGANVRIIEATGSYQNIHGVPKEKIDQMKARWEKLGESDHVQFTGDQVNFGTLGL